MIFEMDIKNVLYNTVKELRVTLEEMTLEARFDEFIIGKQNEIMHQKKDKRNNIFLYATVYCHIEFRW